jgi:hypothetical protein
MNRKLIIALASFAVLVSWGCSQPADPDAPAPKPPGSIPMPKDLPMMKHMQPTKATKPGG